jgi:EmrB/QacA subfamily drug resistance transporter
MDRGLLRDWAAVHVTSATIEIEMASQTATVATRPAYPPATPVFSHADIMRVMFGVMICIFLAALDQTAVVPAIPSIASDLGSYAGVSWVVAAYLITSTISTPVYGKLSDIYGRRRLLVACLAVFIGTSLLCAAARSLGQLIWFRALQGLGGGGLMALTQAAIADVVSPRERGRYQGYISIVWATSSLCGPLVGGFVAQHFSWRWIFWINLPIGLAAIWICHNGLRRLSAPMLSGRPKLDLIGMLLLAGAISVLLLALGWGGNAYAWGSPEILGLAGLGGCLLLLLIVQELRARDPLLPPRVFRSVSYVAPVIVSTLAATLTFTCVFTIPLYFQLGRGVTAAGSGIYVVPYMLASATGNIIGSRWGRRSGTMRGVLRIASLLGCAGLALLAALPLTVPAWAVVVAMIITGSGIGMCLIGSITSAQNALSAQDTGAGTGALLVLRSVGGASGSTLAGTIIASGLIAFRHAADSTASLTANSLHHGAAGLANLADGGLAGAQLGSSFATVYAAAAALATAAFLTTLWMPNTPLRESLHAVPIPE